MYYKSTIRQGYKDYVSKNEHCAKCKHKDKCLTSKGSFRTIRRDVWEEHKENVLSLFLQLFMRVCLCIS